MARVHWKTQEEKKLQKSIVESLTRDGFHCEENRPGHHAHYGNDVVCDILVRPDHPRWAALQQEGLQWFVIECKWADDNGLKMAKAVWQAISYAQSQFTTKDGEVVSPWMSLLAFQPEFANCINRDHPLHGQYCNTRSQMRVARHAGVGTFSLREDSNGWAMLSPYRIAWSNRGEYGINTKQFFPRKSGNTR